MPCSAMQGQAVRHVAPHGDMQSAVYVNHPPLNKDMSDISTAPRIFFSLPETIVDLSNLEQS